ncbi:MAG: LuxR C-terminal-related transcriptional regulator [Planctomycetota bacterium]
MRTPTTLSADRPADEATDHAAGRLTDHIAGDDYAIALFMDTAASVLLVDDAMRIIAANPRATVALKRVHPSPIGRHVAEFFPANVAAERTDLLRRALDSARPLRIFGMLTGVWSSVTYRPITLSRSSTHASQRAVLIVCPNAVHAAGAPEHQDTTHAIDTVRVRQDDLGNLERLTERELEVLRLVGTGLSTNDIAHTLYRSHKTVDGHLLSIRKKLGNLSRVDLARVAIAAGLTEMDDAEIPVVARRLQPKALDAPSLKPPVHEMVSSTSQ